MTTTYLRPSDIAIAVTTAVVAHVLLFLALVVMAARTIVATVQAPPPQDVYVEIRPEMFARKVMAPAEVPPMPEDQQFVRTLASQASSEEARETPLFGENNTKASGDAPVDPNAPRLPSIAGIEEEDRKDIDTFDSNFSDGEDSAPVPTARPLQPVPPPAPESATPGEPVPLPEETKEAQEAKDPGQPAEELRQTEDTIPVPRPEGEDVERMEEQLPKEEESEAEPLSANNPGGATAPPVEAAPAPPEDPRFNGEVRKRRLRGSIGNNGPVAPEVRNTPLGRYQAQLSRAVEREWQRNCIRYRNHITPGILTIRFLVDDRGRVSGIHFLDVVEAGEIQKGFTMNSLKQASIPIMPQELKKDLDGEPLELIYNFYF